MPVIYVPWFQMADPTVKRKSGFLMPTYSHSDQLGNTVQVPYYFALSDHYDFTFAPMVTEKAGTLLLGNWRQRLASGAYSVDLAGVWNDGTFDSPADGDFRGSIQTKGKFALDPYYGWGWDILAESDETFRRFYNLDSRLKTDRVSQVYLEGLHDRNYIATRFYNTQSLLFSDEPFSDATVFPIIDYDYIVNKPDHRRRAQLQLQRDGVSQSGGRRFQSPDRRSQLAAADDRRHRSGVHALRPAARRRLRGRRRQQWVEWLEDFASDENGDNGAILRGNAVGGIEYRYPFIASTGTVTHVVEPIGQIIARPNSVGDQQEIPNEDALSLVFDDTLLFDIDKFSGYDRIETGTRANVGVRYTAQFASGAYGRAVFGQSYQLAGENEYDTEFYRTSGLATDRSDYVGGLYIQASVVSRLLGAVALRSRIRSTSSAPTLGTWARYGPARVKVNYADVTGEPGLAQDEAREEIVTAGVLAVTEDWSLLGNFRYDLETDQTITDGLGLRYQDDCFLIDVTYQRSFIEDQDIEPDERFLVNFTLKYLGTYALTTDATGVFGASGSDTND